MLTHIDEENNPSMVDVSNKSVSTRTAIASAELFLPEELLPFIEDGEIQSKKGPVFHTAIIAGTQAVKKTWDLIPFCHPIPIESIKISIKKIDKQKLYIECKVKTTGKTGIEIEALSGVQVAALTIYDMCKAVTKEIIIKDVRLIKKTGGKSDFSSL